MSEAINPVPLDLVNRVYESTASAGLLKRCVWLQGTAMPLTHYVGLRAPDDSVLDNLTRSKDTTISYPATIFIGLKAGELLELEGKRYSVREIKAVGDGAQLRAKLTRL
jgi:hypothetical protein